MAAYYKQGSFGWAGGGKDGAIVDMWAVSRFGGVVPGQNAAPPSGSPDAGPVVTETTDGGPGAYIITNIATIEDYYIRFQYGGQSYWGGCPAGTIGGQGSGGGGGGGTPFILNQVVYGPTTSVGVNPGTSPAALDSTHLTVSFTVPASAAVRVTVSIFGSVTDTAEGTDMWLAMATHGTTTLVTPREVVIGSITGTDQSINNYGRVTYDSGVITGLTVGANLQWDVIAAASQSGGAGEFVWDDGLTGGNTDGPVLITVYDPAGTGGGGGGGGGAVTSVSNSDGSLAISPTTGGVIASLTNPLPNTTLGVKNTTSSSVVEFDATTNPSSFLLNGVRYWAGQGLPTDATYGILSATYSNTGDVWYDAVAKGDYICTAPGLPTGPGAATWGINTYGIVFTAAQQIILATGAGTSEITYLYNAAAYIPTNVQTSNYTLQLSDVGKCVEMNSSSALQVTIPENVFELVNSQNPSLEICQMGAGSVTIGSTSLTPTITHVTDVENSANALNTLAVSPAAVGNGVLFGTRVSSGTVTLTPTASGIAFTQIGSPVVGTDTGVTTQQWLGVVTASGSTTINIAFTGTIGTDFVVLSYHEFSSGLGAATTWALDGSAVTVNTTSSVTAVTFPSVTAAGSNELYFANIFLTHTTPAGASAGFSYYGGGSQDLFVWNLAATGTLAPTATQSSAGFYSGTGSCLIASASAVQIDAPPGGANVINVQYGTATLRFRSANEVVLSGDLTT